MNSTVIYRTRKVSRLAGLTLLAVLLALGVVSSLRATAAETGENGAPTSGGSGRTEVRRDNWLLKPAGLDVSQWPEAILNFSIERSDRLHFGGLKTEAISASLDGRTVAIGPDSLRAAGQDTTGTLILLDSSGSMDFGDSGISKLEAAREATLGMIEGLHPQTVIALMSFSSEPKLLIGPTTNRRQIREAMRSYETTRGATHLYDAVDAGLAYAAANGLQNIVLLSDGFDYSPESRVSEKDGRVTYRNLRVERIVLESQRRGLRLFTVAIGDRRPDSQNRLYVDVETLQNMTRGGGFSGYIDLPMLENAAQGDREMYRQLLISELSALLHRIGESFRYSYSLRLPLGTVLKQGMTNSLLRIDFRAGDHLLPLEIPLSWAQGRALPIAHPMRVLDALLIPRPLAGLGEGELFKIYLLLSCILATLAFVPTCQRRVRRVVARRKGRRCVEIVTSRSKHVGHTCPNENDREWGKYLFHAGDTIVICPSCGTVHHLGCWEENGHRCWTRDCGYEVEIENF